MKSDFFGRRRSILVITVISQEGPKNPLKGISVKPVVFASDAQSGVNAGGKHLVLAHSGRFPMAWKTRPCLCGDLLSCVDVLPKG